MTKYDQKEKLHGIVDFDLRNLQVTGTSYPLKWKLAGYEVCSGTKDNNGGI